MPSSCVDAPLHVWSARDQRIIRAGHAIARHFRKLEPRARVGIRELREASGETAQCVRFACARLTDPVGGDPDVCMLYSRPGDVWETSVCGWVYLGSPRHVRRALIAGAVRAKKARWMTGADGARKVVWR